MLVKNDQNFKKSNTYKNNKISFRFLIDQLSLPSKVFHSVLTTLLYAIVVKDDDIKSLINDCNDGLRTVRDTSPCHSYVQNINSMTLTMICLKNLYLKLRHKVNHHVLLTKHE